MRRHGEGDEVVLRCGPNHLIPGLAAKVMADVMDERIAQLGHEFAPEHDDAHRKGELAWAAIHYVASAILAGLGVRDYLGAVLRIDIIGVRVAWPFEQAWWKPGTPRRMLVKACALLLAEIERLDRQAHRAGG